VASAATKQAYTRKGALRLLKLSDRQLRKWEQEGLIPATSDYGFRELIALRSLVQLKNDRVPAKQIQLAIRALRKKLNHVEDPLVQLKLYRTRGKIHVEIEGKEMEAVSGQLLLDFDQTDLKPLVEFKTKSTANLERQRRAEAEHWFQRALEMERVAAPLAEIIGAYEKALELDPKSSGALVNLGTLYFNARKWKDAEQYYRLALDADPEYALAHFDLANLFDERGDRAKALEHYTAALRISPNYADAHYNLALLYQGSNQPLSAVRHWTAYLKLDPSSQWANIARRELTKLRRSAVLPGLK
jgi:tetratricopeptide (TPR) repeat protein